MLSKAFEYCYSKSSRENTMLDWYGPSKEALLKEYDRIESKFAVKFSNAIVFEVKTPSEVNIRSVFDSIERDSSKSVCKQQKTFANLRIINPLNEDFKGFFSIVS